MIAEEIMAKEKSIPITESTPVAKGKNTSAQTTPSIIKHPIAEIERAFDRFFGRGFPSLWHGRDFPVMDSLFGDSLLEFNGQRLPNIDVVDRDNEILVRAELPGVEKKDLTISLTDNLLTIKGESKTEKKEEKGDYHRREISSSAFARSFTLPGSVDSTKAAASLKDGVLEITLPKAESSKKRNIEVK
jgi:HSP20 family protein